MDFDALIVGAGIAGLSTAWHLARAGKRVCLVERERVCGAHASGNNAAIFRSFDADPATSRLAVRSRALMRQLPGSLVRETGALYLGSAASLAKAAATVRPLGIEVELLDPAEVARRFPLLAPAPLDGAFVASEGVIDVHALLEALRRAVLAERASLRLGAEVTRIEPGHLRQSVLLNNDEVLWAPQLVLAGGAWNARLGELAGLSMPIEPRRRHLALLEPRVGVPPTHPVVWRLDDEVYFRPESGGVLASPCDGEPWPAEQPPVTHDQLSRLGALLSGLAPALATSRVRRAWSCLRSFAPGGAFVIGADPRADGVFWLAGLGGRGMTCGLALGEALAATCCAGRTK